MITFSSTQKLRAPLATLNAECRYALPALGLLRNQSPPLRPRLCFALSHPPRVRHPSDRDKLGSTYRSRINCDEATENPTFTSQQDSFVGHPS